MKKLRKFKYKTIGKGSEKSDTYHIDQVFDVLGYVPVEYQISANFKRFNNIIELYMNNVINKTNIDDLNADMFDALIDSEGNNEKAFSAKQYAHHISTIKTMTDVLNGQISKTHALIDYLNEDIEECDKELIKLQKIKDDKKII